MNLYIVGGVFFGALSLLLLAYAGVFSSRNEARQSEEQLDRISRDLADLKGRPKSDLPTDAVARVEKDIQQWATKFASDKQRKKLVWDQKRSEHELSREHSNALAREYFTYFLAVIRDALTSYSKANGDAITVNLPEVPPSLFTDENPSYIGTAAFSSNTSWKISTIVDNRSPSFSPPWIIMKLVRRQGKTGAIEKGELDLRFSSDGKMFWLRLQQDFMLAVPIESITKPTTEYEQTIKGTLIGLIEFQLLQD